MKFKLKKKINDQNLTIDQLISDFDSSGQKEIMVYDKKILAL